MIAKTYIDRNLAEIAVKFKQAKRPKDHLLFSKMAILELCGWIEVSVDDLVLRMVKRRLTGTKNIEFYENSVGLNYGFHYDKHVRKLLIQGIGLINVEKVEAQADAAKFLKLKSELGNLNVARNKLAHTYLKGVTASIDAPSTTVNRFNAVYEGLKEVERVVWSVT